MVVATSRWPFGVRGYSETVSGDGIRVSSAEGRWVLTVTVLGSALVFLDSTVVNVALPTIGQDLDASVSGLEWVVNGYLLTLSALIMLGGGLGDRYGRRRVFVVGVVWFTLASVLCAAAPTDEILVVARVLQGAGAALVTPGSLAIIRASFEPSERARAIGAWSALSGLGAALGPLVGGWFVDAVSWRAVFLLNVPFGIAIVAASRRVPESRDRDADGPLDVLGAALATVGLAGVTFALIEASSGDVAPAVIAAAAVVGVAALVGFVLVEHRSASPMLPLALFSSSQFTFANVITFVVYAALGGVFFLFVIYLQTVLGYSALQAGAATLPVSAVLLVLSPRSGALAQRIGPRWQLTIGPFLLAGGMLLMATIEPGDSYVTGVLPAVLVFGLGLATVVAPVTATALASVDAAHAGVASGFNNSVSRIGQIGAVAALPLVAGLSGSDFQNADALEPAFPTAMIAAAALAASGGVVAVFTIRRDALEESPETESTSRRRRARPRTTPVARS
jgi:EmrB/QacA subfamily drug resistance transporter